MKHRVGKQERAPGRGIARGSRPAVASPAGWIQGRRFWFRLAALFSPLLLVALAEVVLRILGVGHPTSFFLRVIQGGRPRLIENPRFGWTYFPASLARSPQPLSLDTPKPPGTFRIFVLGESAAMGDPEPAYGLARHLERLLQARHPDRKFEVVNAAMTAINSHVVRDIANDCAGADGDCWVIYPGNNEVVGPFGAGTIFGKQAPSLAAVRFTLAFRRTRLGQALSRLQQAGRAPAEWQGMEMFLDRKVTRTDPRLARVYANFARNLEAIVRSGKQSGAKVILATMAVNLSDCPPFGSSHRPGLTPEQSAEWQQDFEHGRNAERESRFGDALADYQRASRIDDQYAELAFRRAACERALGDTPLALADFVRARDLDTLRFRADSRLNEIVRQTAAAERIALVDAELQCANLSAGLIAAPASHAAPGFASSAQEYFYDHVHLNFAGNYWLATLLLPVVEDALFAHHEKDFWPPLGAPEVADRLAFTDYDRRLVFEEMRARLQQPPFSGQSNFQQRDTMWATRLASLTEPPETGMPIYRAAIALAPEDWVLHARFGQLLEASDDKGAAIVQWQKVTRMMPHEPEAFYRLGNLAQSRRAYSEAEGFFRQALQIRPESTEALNGLGLVAQARGEIDEARRCYEAALRLNPRYFLARLNLAVLLAGNGSIAEAKKEYTTLLRMDPSNVAAMINFAKLQSGEGNHAEAIGTYEAALKLQPANAVAHYNLANTLCLQKRYSEAMEHYRAAIRAKPDFVAARNNLGLELARSGNLAEAMNQFSEVLRLEPGDAEAHYNYGVALARERRFAEAAREFRETLRLQPAHPSAAQMLERASKLAEGKAN